jgi:uncharacterized protein (TIGR00251 family)
MAMPEQIEQSRGNDRQVTRIAVKVAAGAANSAISGWRDQCLRVRLSTAAERGKANSALIALLAKSLGLSKSSIRIVKGQHSAHKTLEITGLIQEDIINRLIPEQE